MYDKVKQSIPIIAWFITFMVALFIFSKIGPIAEQNIKSETLKSVNLMPFYAFLSMLAGLFAINLTKKRLNINYNYIPFVACIFITIVWQGCTVLLRTNYYRTHQVKNIKGNFKVFKCFRTLRYRFFYIFCNEPKA